MHSRHGTIGITAGITCAVADYSDCSACPAGAVYWGPCKQAVDEAVQHIHEPEYFSYNFDHGLPALREKLLHKIRTKNGLEGVRFSGSIKTKSQSILSLPP